jgi:selenocysteine lyase/cysteine desulfurase
LFGIRIPKKIDLTEVKLKLQNAKISVSIRGNAIRVSPHVYNTEAEMLKLVKVLLS